MLDEMDPDLQDIDMDIKRSPIEQIEALIATAAADMERHKRNLAHSRELYKRLNATLDTMRETAAD